MATGSGLRTRSRRLFPVFGTVKARTREAKNASIVGMVPPKARRSQGSPMQNAESSNKEEASTAGEGPQDSRVVRLVHLSDVHIAARSVWLPGDWLGKRLTSWINLRCLGRGKRFRRS